LLPVLWKQGNHGLTQRVARESYDALRSLGNKRRAAQARPYLR
jgi:hypothetical protein